MGAAASSLLTNLFTDNPNATAEEKEAKRNLIATVVAGIAGGTGADGSAAINSAIAATDNNWLTQDEARSAKLAQASCAGGDAQACERARELDDLNQERDQEYWATYEKMRSALAESGISYTDEGLREYVDQWYWADIGKENVEFMDYMGGVPSLLAFVNMKEQAGQGQSLTRNGNVLDMGALAHDVLPPLLDSPEGALGKAVILPIVKLGKLGDLANAATEAGRTIGFGDAAAASTAIDGMRGGGGHAIRHLMKASFRTQDRWRAELSSSANSQRPYLRHRPKRLTGRSVLQLQELLWERQAARRW